MAMRLISMLSNIPKHQIKYLCHVNIRRSHKLINGIQLKVHLQKERCCTSVTIPSLIQIRKIRVTVPNRALHPIILLLLRPITKILTVFTGRLIRKWWKTLTPEEKKIILDQIWGKKSLIAAVFTFAILAFILYYYNHIVETPLTKRKRFIMLSDEAMLKISEYMNAVELRKFRKDVVPVNHPFYKRVSRVVDALISANKDIPELKKIHWSLTVIDRPDVTNAFCLPDGKIIVFTGILNLCTNDDQLAVVISHEVAHTILSHGTENLSKTYLVEAFLLIPSFICWIIFTDMWAVMSEWVTSRLAAIFFTLPFNRALEREADMVGLFLSARACFDVREASVFWSKMGIIESMESVVGWLSTHPSSGEREVYMKTLLPSALEIRQSSHCPPLKKLSFMGKIFW